MADSKNWLLERLFTDHGKALRRYLTRKLGNPEEAEEIAQEAMLRLHRLKDSDTLDNARAFLFQVASNMAIDQLRRRSLQHQYLQDEGDRAQSSDIIEEASLNQSPEEVVIAREQLAAMYQAIESMPENWRQAFLLHRVRGLSYTDIAHTMDVSVSSVEKYVLEALKYMRKSLAP